MLHVEPTHNHIALRPVEESDLRKLVTLENPIVMPDNVNQHPGEFIIVSMGKFRFPNGEPMPLPWKEGDRVAARFSGVQIVNPATHGCPLLIVHINDILGFIKEESEPTKFPMLEIPTKTKNN